MTQDPHSQPQPQTPWAAQPPQTPYEAQPPQRPQGPQQPQNPQQPQGAPPQWAQQPHYGVQPSYGAQHGGGSGMPAHGSPAQSTGYQFRFPAEWPRSAAALRPRFERGFSSIFSTAHMPTDAKIGYWVWLVLGTLTVLSMIGTYLFVFISALVNPVVLWGTGMVSLFGTVRWGLILAFIATGIIGLAMQIVQLYLTLRLREAAEWARMALTLLTLAAVVYQIIIAAVVPGPGTTGTVVTAVLSVALLVPFWLPRANAWFLAQPRL